MYVYIYMCHISYMIAHGKAAWEGCGALVYAVLWTVDIRGSLGVYRYISLSTAAYTYTCRYMYRCIHLITNLQRFQYGLVLNCGIDVAH